MRHVMMCLVVLCVIALAGGVATAQQKDPAEAVAQGLVETVVEGCKTELATYCKNVTPGEGRALACLYAYGDKLSNRCEYALYDAAAQLQRAVTALSYAANECRDDLAKFCSNIKPGEGRLLQCIDKNSAKVSARCKQALKDTGLK
jgi:hypothetical protein